MKSWFERGTGYIETRSNHSYSSRGDWTRSLFHPFLSPTTFRVLQAGPGSKETNRLVRYYSFQNGDIAKHHTLGSQLSFHDYNRHQDGYIHVPMYPTHQMFLRFAKGHIHFLFRVLPFGLNLAPKFFTKLFGTIGCSPLFVHPNLDDWVVHCLSRGLVPISHGESSVKVKELWFPYKPGEIRTSPFAGQVFQRGRVLHRQGSGNFARWESVKTAILYFESSLSLFPNSCIIAAASGGMLPWTRFYLHKVMVHILVYWNLASQDLSLPITLDTRGTEGTTVMVGHPECIDRDPPFFSRSFSNYNGCQSIQLRNLDWFSVYKRTLVSVSVSQIIQLEGWKSHLFTPLDFLPVSEEEVNYD